MSVKKYWGFAAAVLLLSGCQSQVPGLSYETACQDPRPEVCTMEYRPVCGVSQDGSKKVYGNACGACGQAEVQGYSAGEC